MEVIITDWALDSYLELKHSRVFKPEEYKEIIRPDVKLLKEWPILKDPKFLNSKFWGPAKEKSGVVVPHVHKMKWHQIGAGRVQLRLGVVLLKYPFLCQAYVKANDKVDARQIARLKIRARDIELECYVYRGAL